MSFLVVYQQHPQLAAVALVASLRAMPLSRGGVAAAAGVQRFNPSTRKTTSNRQSCANFLGAEAF
ncbi:hypothetical protein AN697_16145 [Enterobacter cloacae subsp. cloacae]|nr:hypothetical protein AN697_16145 [Enterobacter cloacae subsp. cloacae]